MRIPSPFASSVSSLLSLCSSFVYSGFHLLPEANTSSANNALLMLCILLSDLLSCLISPFPIIPVTARLKAINCITVSLHPHALAGMVYFSKISDNFTFKAFAIFWPISSELFPCLDVIHCCSGNPCFFSKLLLCHFLTISSVVNLNLSILICYHLALSFC